jgi:hypothetical protein
MELDILSDRIDGLVKALRVRGVYDASQPALQRLMTEGDNNALIPVDKWMAFSEKGGLKGSIDLLPLDTLATALLQCYQARQDIKGQIYEITGIADIIRGQSAASETATAQQIKGQYAGLRLRSMQEDVALFASNLIRLKAQVMATKFQPQTILTYAAAQQMSPQDQQLIPQAIELLKDRPLRNFRIDVAADSLVMLDENQNKQERMEFLQAFGGFLQQALPVAQASPPMVPMMVELMKFGIQAFKQSRPLEGALDQALDQMQQMAAQPNPEAQAAQQAVQVEQQKAQVAMQMEQAKMQASQQVESAKMQLEQAKMTAQAQNDQAKLQMEMQLEQQRQQFEAQMKAQELAQKQEADRYKADLDAATKVMVARISANPGLDIPMFEAQQQVNERVVADLGAEVKSQMDRLAELYAQMAEDNRGAMAQISAALASLSAPKRIVRGQDGRAVGVEPVQLNLQ